MRLYLITTATLLAISSLVCVHADSLGGYPLLRESFDPGLQHRLEQTLTELGMSEAVKRKQLTVSLVDITNPDEPRLAMVNGDEMLYAASLPKIAILLAAFVEIERGNMRLDEATRRSLVDMIRVSSNMEATRILNRVGKQNLLDILRSERFRFYDPLANGGLWVGKEYGKSGAYARDPLHNLSHGATALQVARFYYLLETEQLLDPRLCQEMKAIMGQPAIAHKFVKGLAEVPGVRLFRKSGTWADWHSDSAIVESGDSKYIVVALAKHRQGARWLTRLIRPLHDLIVPAQVAGLN